MPYGASCLTNSWFVPTFGWVGMYAPMDYPRVSGSIMSKTLILQKLLPWFEARKKYQLSHAQIQMARELGLNPKKFGGLANHRQEPWKLPLPNFIEEIYLKRFGVERPAEVISLEDLVARDHAKRERKREAKRQRVTEAGESPQTPE